MSTLNPTVASYTAPTEDASNRALDLTKTPILAYHLYIYGADGVTLVRSVKDVTFEVGTQSTPLPTDLPVGKYKAGISTETSVGEGKVGALVDFEVAADLPKPPSLFELS